MERFKQTREPQPQATSGAGTASNSVDGRGWFRGAIRRSRSSGLVFLEAVAVDPRIVVPDAFTFGSNEIGERRRPLSEHRPRLI
jgi:hypothetical protein